MAENTVPYFNQFVIGSEQLDELSNWKRISLTHSLTLFSSPSLNVEQVSVDDRSLILLGHILDPRMPELTNTAILQKLLNDVSNKEELFTAVSPLGGRWVIIYQASNEFILFHDALGLRQVLHTNNKATSSLWVMSQPSIVACHLRLTHSEEAESFIDSFEFRTNPQYRWPAFSTPFNEISRLLPNHYLDLALGDTHRYWPNKNIAPLTVDSAKEVIRDMLEGAMTSFLTRFECLIGLTAGLDSRLVLAAARRHRNMLSSVTVRQGGMVESHQDLAIAGLLSEKYLKSHAAINAFSYMSPEFSYLFKSNVYMAHDIYGADAEQLYASLQRQYFVITGSGSEVGRLSYRESDVETKAYFDARELAGLQNMGDNAFAIEQFDKWLVDVRQRYNVHLLDLFGWEQGHGVWLATTQLEFDVAWRDIFTPFNNRLLLETFLAVPAQYRENPTYEIYMQLMRDMWPDLLEIAINPDDPYSLSRIKKLKRKTKVVIKKIFKL